MGSYRSPFTLHSSPFTLHCSFTRSTRCPPWLLYTIRVTMPPGPARRSALRRSASERTAVPSTETMTSGVSLLLAPSRSSAAAPSGSTFCTTRPCTLAGRLSSPASATVSGVTVMPSDLMLAPAGVSPLLLASSGLPFSCAVVCCAIAWAEISRTLRVLRSPPFK